MSDGEFTVRKYIGYLPMSEELAMERGLIPDTRPPAPRPPWRRRVRRRIAAAVRPVRLRLAARLGGVTVADLEEATRL